MSNIWYGSLNNRLAERAQQPTPIVGMGVTECNYSDRHPWEIIEVKDEKHITIRQMGCERIDKNGMSDCQEYRYFSKPDGDTKHLVLRNGRWRDRKVGYKLTNKLGCDGWSLGRAEEYYDFTF